jgi:2-keto-4-pentenoate hydratase
VDAERLTRALQLQLDAWRAALESGARRIGWKVALHIAEVEAVVGAEPVFGHLTSATQLSSGDTFDSRRVRELCAESELAVELGRDAEPDEIAALDESIAGFSTALELVDVGRPPSDFEAMVAANVMHRAFALGPSRRLADASGLTSSLRVNGVVKASGTTTPDYRGLLAVIARQLDSCGERLRAGDRVIMGSVTHVPVGAGDVVEVEIERLGALTVTIR